jgi:hypothetical protein
LATLPNVPTTPQNFTATPGNGRVTLSWSAPSSNGGSSITRYQVSSDNGVTWVTASSNTSHTFTGLTNGISHIFRVRAINSAGNGAEAVASAIPQDSSNAACACECTRCTPTNCGIGGQSVDVTVYVQTAPSVLVVIKIEIPALSAPITVVVGNPGIFDPSKCPCITGGPVKCISRLLASS